MILTRYFTAFHDSDRALYSDIGLWAHIRHRIPNMHTDLFPCERARVSGLSYKDGIVYLDRQKVGQEIDTVSITLF